MNITWQRCSSLSYYSIKWPLTYWLQNTLITLHWLRYRPTRAKSERYPSNQNARGNIGPILAGSRNLGHISYVYRDDTPALAQCCAALLDQYRASKIGPILTFWNLVLVAIIPSRNLSKSFQQPFKNLSTTYQKPLNNLSKTFKQPFKNLSTTFQTPFKNLSKPFQQPFKNLSKTFQQPFKNLSTTFQKPFNNLTKTFLQPFKKL